MTDDTVVSLNDARHRAIWNAFEKLDHDVMIHEAMVRYASFGGSHDFIHCLIWVTRKYLPEHQSTIDDDVYDIVDELMSELWYRVEVELTVDGVTIDPITNEEMDELQLTSHYPWSHMHVNARLTEKEQAAAAMA